MCCLLDPVNSFTELKAEHGTTGIRITQGKDEEDHDGCQATVSLTDVGNSVTLA